MKHLSSISIFLFIFIGCSLFDDDSPKDPRDYTWSIDTLSHPDHTNYQLAMRKMWASSADNIYLVGHSSSGNGAMWHYNGKSWSVVPIIKMFGGTVNNTSHSINDIFGFSKHDVWAVGGKSGNKRAFVIHYNGIEWKEITPPDTSQLMAGGGLSSNDIWVGAYGGGIFKYDGTSWQEDNIIIPEPPGNGSYVHDFFARSNQSVYSYYIDKENDPVYKNEELILKNTGNNWDVVYKQSDYDISGLWVSEEGTLYTAGFQIIKFGIAGFEIVGEIPSNFGAYQIYGTSEINLFACGRYIPDDQGTIFYYNGKEWIDLLEEKIKGVAFVDIWTDGKMVIALGSTTNPYGNTIILRGE